MTRREINAVSIFRITFFLRYLPLPYVITKPINIYLTRSSAYNQAQGVEWRFVPDGMTEDMVRCWIETMGSREQPYCDRIETVWTVTF